MPLDAPTLASSLVATLAREFPWATPPQLEQAVQDSLSVFADARVQAFLPILAGREARRALKAVAPTPAAATVPTAALLVDLTEAPKVVGSLG